jgi:hypothetical protein
MGQMPFRAYSNQYTNPFSSPVDLICRDYYTQAAECLQRVRVQRIRKGGERERHSGEDRTDSIHVALGHGPPSGPNLL